MHEVLGALREQLDELRALVEPLDDEGWARPSACAGWSVSDVVLHLAQTNELTVASLRGDLAEVARGWAGEGAEGTTTVDDVAGDAVARERGASGAEVLARWVQSADDMMAAFAACDPSARVPWVVGELAARTLASTRLSETWIHTGDVCAGLGVDQPPSDRIWHIVRLVHRTLPYAFGRAGKEAPGPVRFELDPPEGGPDPWVFGEDDAPTVVTGPAVDLCRVAGQRAAAKDTMLVGTGPGVDDVLRLVRTFA